jgi:hypothetical protein
MANKWKIKRQYDHPDLMEAYEKSKNFSFWNDPSESVE